MRFDTISFLSDFDSSNGRVAIFHSVVNSLDKGIYIHDIAHGIKAFDVSKGGLILASAANYLNPGVVVACINPSGSRSIVIEVGGGQSYLIGPDNGLLAPCVSVVGGATRAVIIENNRFYLDSPGSYSLSRDIYAPIAVEICKGTDIDEFGQAVDPVKLIPGLIGLSEKIDDAWRAQILDIDEFGNVILNVTFSDLNQASIEYNLEYATENYKFKLVNSLSELEDSELGLFNNSQGLVELRAKKSSFANLLKLDKSADVTLRPIDSVSNVDFSTTEVEFKK